MASKRKKVIAGVAVAGAMAASVAAPLPQEELSYNDYQQAIEVL